MISIHIDYSYCDHKIHKFKFISMLVVYNHTKTTHLIALANKKTIALLVRHEYQQY